MKNYFILICTLLLSFTSYSRDVKVAVVVNPENNTNFDTDKSIKDAWLVKSKGENGYFVPVTKTGKCSENDLFLEHILGLNSTQVKQYFTSKNYSDATNIPIALESDEAIIDYVSNHPNAVAYVSFSSLNKDNHGKVKLIQIFDKDAKYPFTNTGSNYIINGTIPSVEIAENKPIENTPKPINHEPIGSNPIGSTIKQIKLYNYETGDPLSAVYAVVKNDDGQAIYSQYTGSDGTIASDFYINGMYKIDLPKYNLSFDVVVNNSDDQEYMLQLPSEQQKQPLQSEPLKPIKYNNVETNNRVKVVNKPSTNLKTAPIAPSTRKVGFVSIDKTTTYTPTQSKKSDENSGYQSKTKLKIDD